MDKLYEFTLRAARVIAHRVKHADGSYTVEYFAMISKQRCDLSLGQYLNAREQAGMERKLPWS